MPFKRGELVWVKLDKYPLWPCKILRERVKQTDDCYYYKVKFLGESNFCIVIESDVFKFDPTRPQFTPSKQILKANKNLATALKEAEKEIQKLKEAKNTTKKVEETQKQVEKKSSKNQKQKDHLPPKPTLPKKGKAIITKQESIISISEEEMSEEENQISNTSKVKDTSKFFLTKYMQKQREKQENKSKRRFDVHSILCSDLKPIQEIQLMLESIVFLMGDGNSNKQTLVIKLRELTSFFDLDKLTPVSLFNSKISSLLSYIVKKLPSSIHDEKEWLKKTIQQINQRVISQINNYEFYQNIQKLKQQFFNNAPVEHKLLSPEEKDYESYRPKVINLLKAKISEITGDDLQFLVTQMMSFLVTNKYTIDGAWRYLKDNIKSSKGKNDCLRDIHHHFKEYKNTIIF